MNDPRDYKLELSTAPPKPSTPADQRVSTSTGDSRPFLSVQFRCCNVYQRIYRNRDGAKYEGRCPRCGKPITFTVGAGGTDSRTFVVE